MAEAFITETLNVHRAARDVIADAFKQFGGAFRVLAEVMRADFLQRRVAFRAVRWEDKRTRVCATLLEYHLDDFRDDAARFSHDHAITNAQIQFLDEILVVQRGTADLRTLDHAGFEFRHGRDLAGAPNLHGDGPQARGDFFGLELVRNRPTWRTGGEAKLVLKTQIVDLSDAAIGVKLKAGAFCFHAVVVRLDAFRPGHDGRIARDGKTHFLQEPQQLRLGRDRQAPMRPKRVKIPLEVPGSRDARVFLPQAACRRVARVFEGGLTVLLEFRVDACKFLARQVHLAAHFQVKRFRQRAWNAGNGEDVGGHVLAGFAIATRRGPLELALLVEQIDRETINFQFANVLALDAAHAHHVVQLVLEGFQVAQIKRVVQAHHRRGVLDRREQRGHRV